MQGSPVCRHRAGLAPPGSSAVDLRLAPEHAPPGGSATSATAALLASAVAAALVATAAATTSDPETYQTYAAAFVLVPGLVFLAAGLAQRGFITQFLSKQVMAGFVTGLAIFVAVGQLNKLFGVAEPEGNTVEKLIGIIKELPQANWVTFRSVSLRWRCSFLLRAGTRRFPAGLVVLFAAIGLSAILDLSGNYGVAVVGTLPQGFPSPDDTESAVHDLSGDGAAGDWRLAGGVQRGAGCGATSLPKNTATRSTPIRS